MKLVIMKIRHTSLKGHKRNVLHELYHHIVKAYELDMSEGKEERNADRYAREVLNIFA